MSANEKFDKFYVGLNLMGVEDNGIQRPISRVTLLLDDENILTAGDDTGLEITADCPHATQAMVDALLEQLKGSRYKMYSSTDAKFDPAAELGDGITVGDIYSCISRIDDDGMGFPSPSAPGKEELEDEYPAGGPMTQFVKRKIGEIRSSITKTAEEIKLQVDDMENRVSSISTKIDSITLSVENGSTSSTIKLLAGTVEIASQNIIMNGLVTFKGLADGTTTIDGGCLKTGSIDSMTINGGTISGGTITGSEITGSIISGSKLKGEQIELLGETGKTAAWIGLSGVYNEINGRLKLRSYFVSVIGVFNPLGTIYFGDFENNQDTGGIYQWDESIDFIGRHGRKVCLGYEGSEGEGGTYKRLLTVGYDTVTFDYNSTNTVHCYNNLDMHNYSVLNTSDRRLKKNIAESDTDALSVINSMQTYSFDWRENGKHENLGFIAQQLETVNPDFVNINQSDGHYSTKDLKIIPYLVKAIQDLSEKFDKLENGE